MPAIDYETKPLSRLPQVTNYPRSYPRLTVFPPTMCRLRLNWMAEKHGALHMTEPSPAPTSRVSRLSGMMLVSLDIWIDGDRSIRATSRGVSVSRKRGQGFKSDVVNQLQGFKLCKVREKRSRARRRRCHSWSAIFRLKQRDVQPRPSFSLPTLWWSVVIRATIPWTPRLSHMRTSGLPYVGGKGLQQCHWAFITSAGIGTQGCSKHSTQPGPPQA
jgi:hypothetical protein